MSRIAKPIEILLKLKQIKPDIEFTGADAEVYQNFIEEQAEENLISAIQTASPKTKKKSVKKIKQTIDPETVETGELEATNETIDTETTPTLRPEEEHESL